MTSPRLSYWDLRRLALCAVTTPSAALGRCTLGFAHEGPHGDLASRLGVISATAHIDRLITPEENP